MMNKIILKRNGVAKVYSLSDEAMLYAQALLEAMRRQNEKKQDMNAAETPREAVTLAKLRRSKDYTQSHVASRLGLSRTTVAMWENCRTTPTVKNIVALAALYDVTVDDICACLKK